MVVRRVLVTAAVVGVVVLAGCGQETSAPAARAPAASPTPAPGEPTGLAAAPDDTWTPWGKGAEVTELGATGPAGFTAADGTVACLFDPGDGEARVRCDRTEGLGVDQPRPAGCRGDWGDAVATTVTGRGALVCAGDTVVGLAGATDGSVALADGEAATYAGLTCAVRGSAVQCLGSPGPTGYRGFVVSTRVLLTR